MEGPGHEKWGVSKGTVPKAYGNSLSLWVICSLQVFSCRILSTGIFPDLRNFGTKPFYENTSKMDGIASQAERSPKSIPRAWCCSSCLLAHLRGLSWGLWSCHSACQLCVLPLPQAGSYLAALRPAQLSCRLHFVVGERKPHCEAGCVAQELESGCSWDKLLQNETGNTVIHTDPPAGLFVQTV